MKPPKDGLFAIQFTFSLTATSLFQTLIPLAFISEISWLLTLGEVVFRFFAAIVEVLIKLMLAVNQLSYRPGMSYQNIVSPPDWLLILFYVLLFFCFSEWFRILWQRNQKRKIAGLITIFVVAAFLFPSVWSRDCENAGIVFLDVGQGDCLILRTPKGKCILVDGGGSQNFDVGKKTLLPFLLKHGVNQVDIAFVSHLHDDHFLGIVSLAKEIKMKKLGVYAANRFREDQILERTGLKQENMLYLVQGQRIQIEEGIYIDILYPQAQTEEGYRTLIEEETDENKSSLLMKISYQGLEILMTGDMGFAGEEAVLDVYQKTVPNPLQVDILKIGHHGSKYSTSDEFLETVAPKLAVFQVGKNNFGHPNKGVIEKCEKSGIMCYRNDKSGAIMCWKGKKWHIETMLP